MKHPKRSLLRPRESGYLLSISILETSSRFQALPDPTGCRKAHTTAEYAMQASSLVSPLQELRLMISVLSSSSCEITSVGLQKLKDTFQPLRLYIGRTEASLGLSCPTESTFLSCYSPRSTFLPDFRTQSCFSLSALP